MSKPVLMTNPLEYNSTEFVGQFNCGGFALQTLEWYIPKSFNEMDSAEDEYVLKTILQDCVNDIIEDFENSSNGECKLVRVPGYAGIPNETEIIGFRISYIENTESEHDEVEDLFILDDFHFIWRDTNGKWWDKPGPGDVKEFKNNIDHMWNNRYNGEIVWFAKMKQT